jgi:transposase
MTVPIGGTTAVEMVEPEELRRLRELRRQGWGTKRIARELGIARNTVRRYLRDGDAAEQQGPIEAHRPATVPFETVPGQQMQIDFAEKRVFVGGTMVRVYLFVAVLSHSRRIYVRPFLSQRQDDWREGLVDAFRHLGGLPFELLVDNAPSLILERDPATGTATVHPAFASFCKEWGVGVRACQPCSARTKGKTESGVKFVKRNAISERVFTSFAALEAHLAAWCLDADERVHDTTNEVPRLRFERDERALIRPLPATPLCEGGDGWLFTRGRHLVPRDLSGTAKLEA